MRTNFHLTSNSQGMCWSKGTVVARTWSLSRRSSINSYKERVDCIWYMQFSRYTAMSVVGSLVALSLMACSSGSTILDTIWPTQQTESVQELTVPAGVKRRPHHTEGQIIIIILTEVCNDRMWLQLYMLYMHIGCILQNQLNHFQNSE
jgi:hypothetical protein